MNNEQNTKAIVTVSEMARMLGFSRSRLYQLIGTAMPWPVYNIDTRRPVFTEELQRQCLEVRRRNCGVDGMPILFYARAPRIIQTARTCANPSRRPTRPVASNDATPQWLTDALGGLGLNVNPTQAKTALKEVYPQGIAGIDPGEVIRAVFLHCRNLSTTANTRR
jgi:hypothetical protein